MVKHMLRTNLTHKKSPFQSGVPVCFLLREYSFTKKMTTLCRWPFCSVQPSWAEFNGTELHFHSNWGMFTVAKCEVISCDTQYYLWKKALCLCFMLYHCDQQWCHHHLGTESYSWLGLVSWGPHPFIVLTVRSWKFRSTIKSRLAVDPADLHPFHQQLLSFISSEEF